MLHRNYQSQWLKSSRGTFPSWNQMKTFAGLSPFTSLDSEHFKQWLIHIKNIEMETQRFFLHFSLFFKNMGSPPLFPEIDVLNQLFDSPSQIYICTFLVCISSEKEYIYISRIFTDRWNYLTTVYRQKYPQSDAKLNVFCCTFRKMNKQKGVEYAIFYT